MSIDKISMERMFPSPCEVNRLFNSSISKLMFLVDQFPSPLEVNRLFYSMERIAERILPVFPSSLEVDRFLYEVIEKENKDKQGFRPLARWIGCFTLGLEKNIDVSIYAFPSPCEVDRFLYKHLADGQDSRFGSFRPLSR